MREKTCCFTGHRPEGLPFGTNEEHESFFKFSALLDAEIAGAIEAGYSHFISGMARGIDLIAAEKILRLKEENENIFLEAAVPFRGQAARWAQAEQRRYHRVLAAADEVSVLEEEYAPWCMSKRNKYMVDKSARIIAVYREGSTGGTKQTISYAFKKKIEVRTILIAHFFDDEQYHFEGW